MCVCVCVLYVCVCVCASFAGTPCALELVCPCALWLVCFRCFACLHRCRRITPCFAATSCVCVCVCAPPRWALVRGCVKEGLIQQMPYDPHHYSLVTATFKRLFPDDYLRAIPVFNHKKTDMLLFKLDQLTNAYMQVRTWVCLLRRAPCHMCSPMSHV